MAPCRAFSAIAAAAAAAAAGVPLAFPGAVGFGAWATGGRGGAVVHVTTLADGGAGSFRDAVSQPNRMVVFDVSGYIVLTGAVAVASNLTIAGQTAPGAGIGIMAGEVSLSKSSNVILRGLRLRQGNRDPDTGKSAINMGGGHDIIMDSCSVAYGQWDSVDAVGTANFTVSNCLIANPIFQQFGAHVEGGPATFFRNAWVNAHNRQPLAKADTQFINNVLYDFEAGYTTGNTGGTFSHDIVANYFVAGPRTTNPGDGYFQVDAKQSAYAAGNLLDAAKDGTLHGVPFDTVGSASVLPSPWAPSTASIPTLPAAAAFTTVLARAGAVPRDAVDAFAAADVASLGTRGTLYKDQATTGLAGGGYGVLATDGVPPPDTNGDGIADYWAAANNVSTTDPGAGSVPYGSTGYTNLEAYVNALVLPFPWAAADLPPPDGAPPLAPALAGASSYNPFTDAWLLRGAGVGVMAPHVPVGQFASLPWTAPAATASGANASMSAVLVALTGAGSGAAPTGKRTGAGEGAGGLLVRGAAGSFVALMCNASGSVQLTYSAAATVAVVVVPMPEPRSLPLPLPLALRLVAVPDGLFAGYISTDGGATWQLAGAAPSVVLAGPVFAGLVYASGSDVAANVGTFTQVTIAD